MATQQQILKTLWFTPGRDGRWGLPVLFWGPPGIGKTAILSEASRKCGFDHVEVLSPGERGEGAFGVIPVPSSDGRKITYPAPDWTERFDGSARGVVFVDEINRAAEALQPPLLGLVNDLRIGGHYLGKNVRVCAAANPSSSAPNVYELDPAQANRMGHLDWVTPNVADWSQWAMVGSDYDDGQSINAAKEEERVMAAWPTAYAKAVGLVTSFLRSFPGLHHAQPKIGDPANGRAWPSPRTWELAMRAIAGAEIHMPGDEAACELLVEAFVGRAAASQFIAWRVNTDLPDPAKLLDGEIKWAHDPKRLDRTVAVLASCAALVCPPSAQRRQQRGDVLWGMIDGLSKKAMDIVEPAARCLVRANLRTKGPFERVIKLLGPMSSFLGS